jgi:hypothetical protein
MQCSPLRDAIAQRSGIPDLRWRITISEGRDLDVREDLNRNSYQLLKVDIETALTFTRIAAGAGEGSDKRTRNQRNGRTAYDSVQHLRKNVSMTTAQEQELDAGLVELKTALEELGEKF